MATHIIILNRVDRKIFETPPVFSREERKQFFEMPAWAGDVLTSLRTPTNKAGFLLQLGYFLATNKFFSSKHVHHQDIEYVARMLKIPVDNIQIEHYIRTTYERHQTIILDHMGVQAFNQDAKRLLEQEARALSVNQLQPRALFLSLVDFLRSKKIEVPRYYALAEIITEAMKGVEKNLVESVEHALSDRSKHLLDDLLSVKKDSPSESDQEKKIQRYTITLLKKSHHSTKPAKIRENVADLLCLKELYLSLHSVIDSLNLTPECIQYYAKVVIKSQVFQIARRDTSKYLYLLAFVIHQYYKLNDLVIDILMQAVQTTFNTVSRDMKELLYETRRSRLHTLKQVSQHVQRHLGILEHIERIIHGESLSDQEKVHAIKRLLGEASERQSLKEQLAALQQESNRVSRDTEYHNMLESHSIKLQNRVAQIVKHIEFDVDASHADIIAAIQDFQKRDGAVNATAPLGFLEEEQQPVVFETSGKFRPSLYKVLLFEQVRDAIRSGALNLAHSYKFKPFEEYLIPKDVWNRSRHELLPRAGLHDVRDFDALECELQRALQAQFKRTNDNITSGQNPYVTFKPNGHMIVSTPKQSQKEYGTVGDLFPDEKIIPLFEVLATVNKLTNFSACFEHHHLKHVRKRPSPNIFLAGITGYGCNHGIRKIAKISRHITQRELEHAVNYYFSSENILQANDNILELIDLLQLPKLFKHTETSTHTSSDGQKYRIHAESLNACKCQVKSRPLFQLKSRPLNSYIHRRSIHMTLSYVLRPHHIFYTAIYHLP